jgi:ligand-binding SRPBCC domain-containing protein
MTIHTLNKAQVIPAPLDRVFGFFSRPENLARLTPPDLGFIILTPPPIEMKAGALIDYTIRLLGIRVRWTTLITAFDPGRAFVDEQLKGPYSFWHHSHYFEEVPGGTLVRDEVRYALPFGILGRLAHAVAVKDRLEGIFSYRARVVGEIFGGGRGQGVLESPRDVVR